MDAVLKRFKPLIDKPCWGVHHGYGRVLKLEFGAPRLEIREPRASRAKSKRVRELLARRTIFVKGAWSLWTWDCDWSVLNRGRPVGDSRTEKRAAKGARLLDGQRLRSVTLEGRSALFEFDLGARLVTRPRTKSGEQWQLHCPKDYFLSYFSNRTYTFSHGSDSAPSRRPLE